MDKKLRGGGVCQAKKYSADVFFPTKVPVYQALCLVACHRKYMDCVLMCVCTDCGSVHTHPFKSSTVIMPSPVLSSLANALSMIKIRDLLIGG